MRTVQEINEAMAEKAIKNRYDFVALIEVTNGNPNGTPDGNLPRTDAETGLGIITDVCLKRKIRNYVQEVKSQNGETEEGYCIYVTRGVPLEAQQKKAYNYLGIETNGKSKIGDADTDKELTAFMCDNFYDVRTFGAVMTTTANCGQVRGPVQLTFAQSIDPVYPVEISISRITFQTEKEFEEKYKSAESTFGKKSYVPYGLYRLEGYVSANVAKQTGFSDEDLELLWDAIINMFRTDHSASRGKMCTRDLFIFQHDNLLGKAAPQKLFDLIHVEKINEEVIPRKYTDYKVTVDEDKLPNGVKLIRK